MQMIQTKVNVEIIEKENLINNAKVRGAQLKSGLQDLAKKHKLIGDVRGRGLMVGLELVKNRKTKAYATEETAELLEKCKEKGLLLGKGGLFANVIRIAPPLNVTESDVNFMIEKIDESLTEIHKTYGDNL